jgi:Flp pilus assembly protein TadG
LSVRRRRLEGPSNQRGQAAIELVALLPLLMAAGLLVMQLLIAGATAEYAGQAAEAGAVAILQDHDPSTAARSAIPTWTGRDVHVRVHGRRVTVRLRPRSLLPEVGDLLATTTEANAGSA